MAQIANFSDSLSQLVYLNTQTRVPSIARFAIVFAAVVTLWSVRRRTRMELKHLEPEILDDIGLSRIQADTEAEKPFWQR